MSSDNKIKRVDSHQHFWRRDRGDYDWLTADLGPIYADFLPQNLEPHLNQFGIDQTVLVQAAATEAETEFMLELANQHSFIAGVVGWVDMQSPGAVDSLRRLAEDASLKGIRPMIQDIEDEQWMLSDTLTPAFNAMIELELCFDALVKPKHLKYLHRLLHRYPDLKVVIDHGAKPDIASGGTLDWAKDMRLIADETQACCKLSGLTTEAGNNPSYEKVRPYMEQLFECFGAKRLMWGSDWPVLNLASDYRGWFDTSEAFMSELTVDARAAIWSETASSFYAL